MLFSNNEIYIKMAKNKEEMKVYFVMFKFLERGTEFPEENQREQRDFREKTIV